MNAHKMSTTKHQMSRLTSAGVPHAPGIFILFKSNMGPPHYVGRADSDLFETLLGFKSKALYPYFKFMVCKNADDAYQWECIYWHQGNATLDNGEANGGHHPQPPKGSTATCPVPGCNYQNGPATPRTEELEVENERME